MKKIVIFVSVFVLMLFTLLFVYVVITKRDSSKMGLGAELSDQEQKEKKMCISKITGKGMSYSDALKVAMENNCSSMPGGKVTFSNNYLCNENTGTFWVDVHVVPEKSGCNPACVVKIVDATAEINWRCVGALPSSK